MIGLFSGPLCLRAHASDGGSAPKPLTGVT